MKYLHEAIDEELRADLEARITNAEFTAKYAQPDWCNYPDATMDIMGCWSLTDLFGLRKSISKEFCEGCPECKHFNQLSQEQTQLVR
jgi:hypothetical protein